MTYAFPKPQGNGPLVEVWPDIWAVEGNVYAAPGAKMTRNMTIVKQGDELCVINSLRLQPEQEAEMEQLGTVKHLVRLCPGHGMDDPYFADKYKPTVWEAGADMVWPKGSGLKADKVLGRDGVPFPELLDAVVFEHINDTIKGDASLIVKKDQGILVSSDAVMCCGKKTDGTKLSDLNGNLFGRAGIWALGFSGVCKTTPPYIKLHSCNQKPSGIKPDLDKLAAAEWDAIIPPHGTVLKSGAKALYKANLAKIKF